MPVTQGCIGDSIVTVLRDISCSGVVIRKSLVDPNLMTDEMQTCTDGTVITVPTVEVVIDTPFYQGRTKAWCMESPVYDLILGNIVGVRAPDNPDRLWSEHNEVAAVQTRAQKRKSESPLTPMKVAKSSKDVVTREDIQLEQNNDDTLININNLHLKY